MPHTAWRTAALGLSLLSVLGSVAAHAQSPQPCGQEARSAEYGAVRVGSVVVPQRHRFVGGDPNWDPRMARYFGRLARVIRLSGVDDRGCPGVRVDIDDGRWFWRVRDVDLERRRAAEPRSPTSGVMPPLPQRCGLPENGAVFGGLREGSAVRLGRHRPVGDDANWSEQMTPYVGRVAHVVELSGVDDMGCPVVQVDADGRQHFWRIRDLTVGDEDTSSYRPGLASDHGRPSPDEPLPSADERVPQECGRTDETAEFAPVEIGTRVSLSRHRAVDGAPNWVEEMEAYVGREASVTELVGVDEEGCALVHVDVDRGEWFWRLRDLRLR